MICFVFTFCFILLLENYAFLQTVYFLRMGFSSQDFHGYSFYQQPMPFKKHWGVSLQSIDWWFVLWMAQNHFAPLNADTYIVYPWFSPSHVYTLQNINFQKMQFIDGINAVVVGLSYLPKNSSDYKALCCSFLSCYGQFRELQNTLCGCVFMPLITGWVTGQGGHVLSIVSFIFHSSAVFLHLILCL